jgi:hypothetical protein
MPMTSFRRAASYSRAVPETHCGNFARLPQALEPLTEEHRWVVWSWEWCQSNEGGRWKKPPCQSRDPRKRARSNDPDTWSNYSRAVKRWQNRDADGIGFMLLDAKIGASDLDACCQRNAETRKTKIDPWASDLRDEADSAYCEVTVSGRGLHLIGTASGPDLQCRFTIDKETGAAIELFRNTARYITVSGLQLGTCDELPPLDNFLDAMFVRFGSTARQQAAGHPDSREAAVDYNAIIRHGVTEPHRSEAFHRVVWHLAAQGWSVDEITDELAKYPNGIAAKYGDRLYDECKRSYHKWERQKPIPRRGLRVIRLAEGQIAHTMDEAQEALIAAQVPIFSRGGHLVEPIAIERKASRDRTIMVKALRPVGDLKLGYLLNKYAAIFERFDARRKKWVEVDPPRKVTAGLLALQQWDFPEIVGIVGAPTIRPDGSILQAPGYDPATRLWCQSDIQLAEIAEKPTREEAQAALDLYIQLLSGFPFVGRVDRAVALASLLTAVLRGGFDVAPLTLILAHDAGTGKSFLVDLISVIATGRACPVITASKNIDEMEKRLASLLLEGITIVNLDNLSFDLEGDLLCQMTERQLIKVRVLGKSQAPECEWRGTTFADGNNVRVIGDLCRRTLTCRLDAMVERPELREFEFDPIECVNADRGAYIAAAIVIARAFQAAGQPATGINRWGATVNGLRAYGSRLFGSVSRTPWGAWNEREPKTLSLRVRRNWSLGGKIASASARQSAPPI